MRGIARWIALALVAACAGCADGPVSWSPDGKQIVFRIHAAREINSMGHDWKAEIWIADVATGSCKLVDSCDHGMGCPSWSPDGKRIAYLTGEGVVVVWNVEKGERVVLCKEQAPPNCELIQVQHFTWSPDGSSFAGDTGGAIQLYDAASGESHKLSDGAMWPFFSPDGKWILGLKKGQKEEDSSGLTLWPAAGGEPRTIGSFVRAKGREEGPEWFELWSPDAKKIASSFLTKGEGKEMHMGVRITPVDGGPTLDAKFPSKEMNNLIAFAWPGGKQGILAIGSEQTPGDWMDRSVVRINPETGDTEMVGMLPGHPCVGGCSLSPDGSTVAYLARWDELGMPSIRLRSVATGKDRALCLSLQHTLAFLEEGRNKLIELHERKNASLEPALDAAKADCAAALEQFPGQERLVEIQNDISNIHTEK